METFTKQSSERLDYDIDFTQFFDISASSDADAIAAVVPGFNLTPDGFDNATVVTATVDQVLTGDLVVDGPPIKLGSPARVIKVWLKGGVSGRTYKVTVKTTQSSDGRVVEQDFKVKVKDI